MSNSIVPLSLRDAPALIERLLPVQKLSAESYKEQMANVGKTLTALGSYWKGRKPLILNKACVLGCLLPATEDPGRDLEILEKLLGMDDESFVARWPRRPRPKDVLASVSIASISDYFDVEPPGVLPRSAPVDWSRPGLDRVAVTWRLDVNELDRRRLEAQLLPRVPYRLRVDEARRAEEVTPTVHDHIWGTVNAHLGTDAHSVAELVEQLGVMRFGHRPTVADTFSGSGQIPFEAARLGCDAIGSDLNPVACMLTWGAFNVVGASAEVRLEQQRGLEALVEAVQGDLDTLDVETNGEGWRVKSLLYCVEVACPQTGWAVPLLPTRVIGRVSNTIAELIPDYDRHRYLIRVRAGVSSSDVAAAEIGTVRSAGRGQDPYLAHVVNGTEYRTKISTLRGDFRTPVGTTSNRIRRWERHDFVPRADDIFRERLYCVQWMRGGDARRRDETCFRAVDSSDLERERRVEDFIARHLDQWQAEGWIPDMLIEPGAKTDEPIRTRGWTYWHHLFNPRQLLMFGLARKFMAEARLGGAATLFFAKALDWNSRISRWNPRWEKTENVFYNQALNTFYNYGTRAWSFLARTLTTSSAHHPLSAVRVSAECLDAASHSVAADLYITDPPYGSAVSYEEICEYFIAWLRKNPPPEFARWTWDSRRALAIQGEGEDFRRGMVAAYRRMTECMPDNGLQVIMFTHQSGAIWADMANIVWAAGLQVTAAWYVVTETDSALREGSYVKGTVLLVLRKRQGVYKTTRDELAWEIQEEVERQVHDLTGLNQSARPLYRDENVFEDADIQMAGYAAALRVLTRYATIDGRDMTAEALRPRVKGETTFVDGLIAFAVDSANRCLVPQGIEKRYWDKLSGADRFYLKMIDMEARGARTLDNYQNFAKAFKVRDFRPFMASQKANEARLRSATEFGRSEMSEGSEFNQSVLRAVLYAVMELGANVDGAEVLAHLSLNVPNYFGDLTQRDLILELSAYLAAKLENLRADEAAAARILRELVRGQRIG